MNDAPAMQARLDRNASFMDEIMEQSKTDPVGAAQLLCEGLMRGHSPTFRMGYSIGSALIATLEQIPLTQPQIGLLVEKIAIAKPGVVDMGPSKFPDAQVYVNVVGGIAEVTVTGGEVEVIHIDWDNLNSDGEPSYWELLEAREEIEKVAMPEYRKRLLADINELIENHEDYQSPTFGLEDA